MTITIVTKLLLALGITAAMISSAAGAFSFTETMCAGFHHTCARGGQNDLAPTQCVECDRWCASRNCKQGWCKSNLAQCKRTDRRRGYVHPWNTRARQCAAMLSATFSGNTPAFLKPIFRRACKDVCARPDCDQRWCRANLGTCNNRVN